MNIIDTLLNSDLFLKKPPVLIDIGASGQINPRWKRLAPYSICLAFEPDEREFAVSEEKNTAYKKLFKFNRIVSADAKAVTDFYLTRSPFCSSSLLPDEAALKPWLFHPLFTVEKKMQLPVITISEAMQQSGVDYIDWFKADTQGTDLRLFKSLKPEIMRNISIAEFEPGIIDAYKEEDKLFSVMAELHQAGFWVSSFDIKGTARINSNYLSSNSFINQRLLRKSPCWAELVYLHNINSDNKRQLLILYVFALLEKQYGFALEIADKAMESYDDPLFQQCKMAVLKKIKIEKLKIPLVILKKQINKFLQPIHD